MVNPQTVGAHQGELRVGPCGALTQRVPGLAERWAEREDKPFLVWSGRLEQEYFLKKKKTLGGTLGNSTTATAPISFPPSRPALPQVCGGY